MPIIETVNLLSEGTNDWHQLSNCQYHADLYCCTDKQVGPVDAYDKGTTSTLPQKNTQITISLDFIVQTNQFFSYFLFLYFFLYPATKSAETTV